MANVIAQLAQYASLIPLFVGAVLALLLHLKQRKLRKLEIDLLKTKQAAEVAPLEAQLAEAEKRTAEAKKAYEDSLKHSN